ncbi:hypothetical protein ACWDGI_03190 [Streptomyces sp. NPDC001220]
MAVPGRPTPLDAASDGAVAPVRAVAVVAVAFASVAVAFASVAVAFASVAVAFAAFRRPAG